MLLQAPVPSSHGPYFSYYLSIALRKHCICQLCDEQKKTRVDASIEQKGKLHRGSIDPRALFNALATRKRVGSDNRTCVVSPRMHVTSTAEREWRVTETLKVAHLVAPDVVAANVRVCKPSSETASPCGQTHRHFQPVLCQCTVAEKHETFKCLKCFLPIEVSFDKRINSRHLLPPPGLSRLFFFCSSFLYLPWF